MSKFFAITTTENYNMSVRGATTKNLLITVISFDENIATHVAQVIKSAVCHESSGQLNEPVNVLQRRDFCVIEAIKTVRIIDSAKH